MTRLSSEQIMDYLDGALPPEERARVESHLQSSAEDRELVDELRFATQSLHDFNVLEYGSEPMRASEKFWPELREKLGPPPKRGFFRQISKSFNRAGRVQTRRALFIWRGARRTRHRAECLYVRAQNAQQPIVAVERTTADQQFIEQSLKQHETYVQTGARRGRCKRRRKRRR